MWASCRRLLLSLNCVMRLRSPMAAQFISTQHSSATSGTWLCTNRRQRSGSRPAARLMMNVSVMRRRMSSGS